MALDPFVGWSLTTLLSWFIGKGNKGADQEAEKPEELSIQETKTGTPVPVVMGRTLLKSPLVVYYGDFRAEPYTETYAAHAQFSAWPLILTTLLQWLTMPITGQSQPATDPARSQHTHGVTTTGGGGTTNSATPHGHDTKETAGPNYLMLLAQWLLSYLINGRNLKTTLQKGFKYHLGYQMLWCHSGPNLRVRAVYMGGTKVWEGDASRESYPDGLVIPVDNDQLFGGPDEGGGFVGEMRLYLGGAEQPADPWMVAEMNKAAVPDELKGLTPAYRSFVSLVVPTAYIGKQATIPETWLEVQYTPGNLGIGPIGEDANPAEIIYETLANRAWGLGELPEVVNVDSLAAMGQTLKQENIGLTVLLSNKTQASQLFDSLMEHINAARYVDPKTGQLTFKLIRDDYDPAKVPLLNETNCSNVQFTRLTWDQTIGEVSVTYTDRNAQYEESSISRNDPGNIAINNGTKNTKSFDYIYFTSAENALWAAEREGRQEGFPLAAATITGNRKLSNIRTGDVVRLDWPPHGISNLYMRVTDVDIGDFIGGEVKIDCIEDVFALGKTTFGFSDSTGWLPPVLYPGGVQVFRYMEFPWEVQQTNDSFVFAMAAQPDDVTQKWTIWRKRDQANWETTNSMVKWTPAGRLVNDYAEFTAAEDLVGLEVVDLGGMEDLAAKYPDGIVDIETARKGDKILVVGDEIMAWSALVQLPDGHWRVQGIIRGTHDTVPAKHAAGDIVFFLEAGAYANVTTGGPVCPVGRTVTEAYNITTATVDHTEEFDPVKVVSLSTVRRPERPNPPGRIRMRDHTQAGVVHTDSVVGPLRLDWVARNKQFSFGCVSQDDLAEHFTGQAFELPAGVEYLVRVYVAGIQRAAYSVDQDHWTYKWEDRCQDSLNLTDNTVLEILSRKGGLDSYQSHWRQFYWRIPHMVDGCETEDDAIARAASWGLEDRIRIPAGQVSGEQFLLYSDMPVIVLGAKVDPETPGAIPCQDGRWIYPDGNLFIVNGKGTGEILRMDTGYTFGCYFVPQASGGKAYYNFDGTAFFPTDIKGGK